MARIAGRLSTLDVSTDGGTNYTPVLCIADLTFNGEGEELDSTCHDDGVFRAFEAGRIAASIDGTLRWDESDPGQVILEGSAFDRTKLDYRFRMNVGSGNREYLAQGIVTNWSPTGPNDDIAGLDVTIRLSGTITRQDQ